MNTQLKIPPNPTVKVAPFPHLKIENALTLENLKQLQAHFPAPETISKGAVLGNNLRFSLPFCDAANHRAVPAIWKGLLEDLVAPLFFQTLFKIFERDVRSIYPSLGIDPNRVGVRNRDSFSTCDVLMDAQICINSPVLSKSTVRGPHVDLPNKLFVGLLYLRDPEDDSQGGDFEIYEKSDPNAGFDGQFIPDSAVTCRGVVPYKAGTLVLLVNSIDSIHGVSPREATPHVRKFVNLVAEVKEPLFSLPASRRAA